MSVLVDWQINQRLTAFPRVASDVPPDNYQAADAKVQAASLDLTIGEIYIPGTDNDKPGGAYMPLEEYSLNQGHTAVIKTTEVLNLGAALAGIGFPPASLSLKGLLMTNPGHIDPGYRGPLHLTVINMSRVPFPLRAGDRIMRVLLIALDEEPVASYSTRHPDPWRTPITPELLGKLSADFVDVEKRAQDIADTSVKKAQVRATLIATVIPVVVAIIALGGTMWAGNLSVKGDLQKLGERVTVVETKLSQQAFDDRLRKLEDAVAKLTSATLSK